MYCKAKQGCKKIIKVVKRIKNLKLVDEVNSDEDRRNVSHIAKQTANVYQDVTNVKCFV